MGILADPPPKVHTTERPPPARRRVTNPIRPPVKGLSTNQNQSLNALLVPGISRPGCFHAQFVPFPLGSVPLRVCLPYSVPPAVIKPSPVRRILNLWRRALYREPLAVCPIPDDVRIWVRVKSDRHPLPSCTAVTLPADASCAKGESLHLQWLFDEPWVGRSGPCSSGFHQTEPNLQPNRSQKKLPPGKDRQRVVSGNVAP